MDQFIEESKNTLADLISIKGTSIAFLDPDLNIQKVHPSNRILRLSLQAMTRSMIVYLPIIYYLLKLMSLINPLVVFISFPGAREV